MKKAVILAVLISVSIAPIQARGQSAGDWKYITSTKTETVLYSSKRLTRLGNGVLKTWIKNVIRGDFDRFLMNEERSKKGLPTEGYEKYSYSLDLVEFDCVNRKSRILSGADYTSDGEVLHSEIFKAVWRDVVPESVGERELEVVCHAPLKTK